MRDEYGMEFNRKNVKRWMLRNLDLRDYIDACGELDLTRLAEDAAAEFGQDLRGGPLDDETHWIWYLPIEVAESFQREQKA